MKKKSDFIRCLIFIIVFNIMNICLVYADGISSSTLFTGSLRLATDLTNWGVGAAAVFAVLMIVICFIRKIGAEPDKARQYNDRIKMIVGALIGVIVAKAIIDLIISYFKG